MPVLPPTFRKAPHTRPSAGPRPPTLVTVVPSAVLGVLALGLLLALGPASRVDSAAGGTALLAAGLLAAGAAFAALTLAEAATARAASRLGLSTGPLVVRAWGPALRDAESPRSWQQARRLGWIKPLATVGAGMLLLVLAAAAVGAGWTPLAAALAGAALLMVALAVLDLLPGPGRSGGLLVLARAWRRSDRRTADQTVARIGVRAGWSLMGLGILVVLAVGPVGLWVSLVGWLTLLSSRMEAARATLHARTAAVPAHAAMTPGAPEVAGWHTVEAVLAEVGATPYQVLPLHRFDGTLQAVLPVDLLGVPGDDRDLRRAQDFARPVVLLGPEEPVERLLDAATGGGVPIGLVVDESRVLGVIGPAELARILSGGPAAGGMSFHPPEPRRSVWDR
jgi:hypothetical protein